MCLNRNIIIDLHVPVLVLKARHLSGSLIYCLQICFTISYTELSALLSGNLAKVLEDYDAPRCTDLYSDDSLPHISSNRSDAVSIIMSHTVYDSKVKISVQIFTKDSDHH